MRLASDGPRRDCTDPTEALRNSKTPSSRLAQTVEFGIGDDALWIEFNERPTTFRGNLGSKSEIRISIT